VQRCELHKRDAQGTFKWPEQELRQLYRSTALPPIGVPQGGALSCLIANAVLHRGDKAIAQSKRQHGMPLLYLRYCDDMILIATTPSACAAACAAYQRTLRSLLLPVHPPQAVRHYDKQFWEEKSKCPYEWSVTGVPWIQFVGYQVRHDALLRIRPSSLKKQITAVTKTTDRLLNTLRRAHQDGQLLLTERGQGGLLDALTDRFNVLGRWIPRAGGARVLPQPPQTTRPTPRATGSTRQTLPAESLSTETTTSAQEIRRTQILRASV
jgi:hypothetical protein